MSRIASFFTHKLNEVRQFFLNLEQSSHIFAAPFKFFVCSAQIAFISPTTYILEVTCFIQPSTKCMFYNHSLFQRCLLVFYRLSKQHIYRTNYLRDRNPNYTFIYLVFYITPSTLSVILWQVVGRPEETSTYSWSRFCTAKLPSDGKLSHKRLSWNSNSDLRGGRREYYYSQTVAPDYINTDMCLVTVVSCCTV